MPSPTPARFTGGVTQEPRWSPLADYGLPNHLWYHEDLDDFANNVALTSTYTVTVSAGCTVANTAGDGGLITYSIDGDAAGDFASIQRIVASFSFTAGKKAFYTCRLQASDVTNGVIIAGLIQTTATPLTVTDGLFFFKATGATTLVLRHAVGGVFTDIAIPALANPIANNTNIDLGWYVDRQQNIYAFVGSQLIGYMQQSGTGAVNSAGVSILPVPGPVAALQQAATPLTLTAVNLNPTLCFGAGTASAKTMIADYWLAAKER